MINSLISIRDISNAGILGLFELAQEYNAQGRKRLDVAHNAIIATLFYEPSTRTRMSFEAAMLRLGGQVISMADPGASSAVKGETLADTVRIVESYADIIALRHPREGAAQVAAEHAGVPIINAGDGAREHPTQTLVDLYTIYREIGRLEGVTVALCGDLKHGRTVHSLAQGLARFGAHMICVAPPGLELPPALVATLTQNFGVNIDSFSTLDAAPLGDCDALYVTRLQKERFADPAELEKVRHSYVVSHDSLTRLRTNAIILHPLPRVDELDFALDGDPRAAYFRQAAYGVPVRMALISALLGLRDIANLYETVHGEWGRYPRLYNCENARCIINAEPGIPIRTEVRKDGTRRCGYCEKMEAACQR
ncbi:MAG: aspartate carbamoyltransferase [bacterium]